MHKGRNFNPIGALVWASSPQNNEMNKREIELESETLMDINFQKLI